MWAPRTGFLSHPAGPTATGKPQLLWVLKRMESGSFLCDSPGLRLSWSFLSPLPPSFALVDSKRLKSLVFSFAWRDIERVPRGGTPGLVRGPGAPERGRLLLSAGVAVPGADSRSVVSRRSAVWGGQGVGRRAPKLASLASAEGYSELSLLVPAPHPPFLAPVHFHPLSG